ncbi:hypothetical protein GKC30_06700 [Pseudodesulfovibrio sp. F-1]|uniref:Uncharacterized protein n=1 Tax=Pseudodesulfovibrio alkaliphilus TaxID=2661613 RepID=A0A7K1KMJ8_9BACT|nr:hypothetical protein [Pseudodesulfovibrio alkaliphilus]MUM77316.1 hypothetical protein [Pseudodesulfovibrio alkaliphilus]
MTRSRSAVIVFFLLALAVGVALSLDYTDTYVAERFRKALAAGQYRPGEPFSLDAFLDYHDWDAVCFVGPGHVPELRNRFGLAYSPAVRQGRWSLVFVRADAVVAEVALANEELAPPEPMPGICLERWAAFVSIEEDALSRRLTVLGH